MTKFGFIYLIVVTVIGISVGAAVAERWASVGFERTLMVAVIATAIVFPAAKLAERFGWIRGRLQLGGREQAAPAADDDGARRDADKDGDKRA